MYVALRATEAIRVTWSDLLLRCSDSRLSGRRFWSSVDGCEREPARILSEAGFSPGGHLLCSACCRMTENKTKKKLLIPFARIGEPDWTHEHALEGGDLLGARRP